MIHDRGRGARSAAPCHVDSAARRVQDRAFEGGRGMRARWAALFVRSRLWRRRSARTPLIIGIAVGSLSACAGIERGRYGISRFELSGTNEMNPQTLRECLLTRERETVAIRLGVRTPECGKPPFDRSPPELRLWTWGWADWP